MNEGSNFISTVIQFAFSLSDARSRRKRIREQAESAQALLDKLAGVRYPWTPHAVPEEPYEDHLLEEGTEDIVSGTSQISAAGKACIPLGVLYIFDNFNYKW